jgi:uncharacterized protein with PIN domain
MQPLFAADRMLGRLARMLRLLGFDTLYAPDMTASQLFEIGRRGERVVLTRGDTKSRFPGLDNVLSLKSEYPPQQLRELVERLGLDTRSGLWTRCTLCNAPIARVDKTAIEPLVAPKVFSLYNEFFRCTGCAHIYWRGSHVERILKNLAALLGQSQAET